jgi:hypothetical protein
MENVTVAESVKGKFGPQVKSVAGDYYSFGKFYKGDTAFAPGTVLSVDLYVSPKGNRYINSLEVKNAAVSEVPVAVTASKKPVARKATVVEDSKESPTKYGKPLSAYELEVERRISRAGVLQAVLQSPSLAPFSDEEFIEKAQKLFDWGMSVVNG